MIEKIPLEYRILAAKNNLREKDLLIREYMPFIIRVTYERTGKSARVEVEDEVAIAMSGFEEAIDKFDIGKGKFLSFARFVITFRLTDYFRKEHRGPHIVQIDFALCEKDVEWANINEAVDKYMRSQENELRQEEITRFKETLAVWNLSLDDLVKYSPGQKRTRERYQSVAECIVNNGEIYEAFVRTKRLPIKKIQEIMFLPRKSIEPGRIYIIGLVIILKGDYSLIRQYIPGG
jgi:RNA polymerase sigma factor